MPNVKELLYDSPVIAAVKDDSGLQLALESACQVVFLLYGSIVTIDSLVQQVRAHNKVCFVHIDLVDGLSNREIAVDGLYKLCQPDGIISTKASQIRRAQQLGMFGVQRVFLLDSMSLENMLEQMDSVRADFIEVLPGVMPIVIEEIAGRCRVPLIAGGLIRNKKEVIQAIDAGVIAVSTSCRDVWEM